MDVYQGSIGSISPAIGPYTLEVFCNIDRPPMAMTGIVGVTGVSYGVTGTGTLVPVQWDVGLTGIQASNFTNLRKGL